METRSDKLVTGNTAPLPWNIGHEAERGKCAQCAYRNLCLPPSLSGRALAVLEGAMLCRRRVAREHVLFREGQPFRNLYAVRLGHFMSIRDDHCGGSCVTGFHMAGELLGMDAIGSGRHASAAVALEDAEVCELPYARLQDVLSEYPQLMLHFHRILSQEIEREQSTIRLLGTLRSDERLASLLLNLSSRYAMRGFSPRRFRLRMTREQMARHLGLTLETVSRLLGRFRAEGLIALTQRDVELLDLRRLERIAEGGAR
jgi:CRP/FNR family transcriptional regulator